MRLFFLVALFAFTQIQAQSGYFSVGGTSITNNGFNPGFAFGGGYRHSNFSGGFLGEFYGIGKGKSRFGVASLDLRAYLQNKNVSPYFSLQPGIVLYEKTLYGMYMKGNFAGSVVLGLDALFKEDRPGLNLFVGYQYISFKVNKLEVSGDSYFKSGIILFLN
jgi:hypothetical protein